MAAKVLLIDDEKKLVTNLKVFLDMNGYTVIPAYNGIEGLDRAQAERPDIIVSDIMMPGMDGYSMLKEIKANPDLKHIPVVMLTAKEGMNDLCDIEGAAQFLAKPFDLNTLLSIIRRYENN